MSLIGWIRRRAAESLAPGTRAWIVTSVELRIAQLDARSERHLYTVRAEPAVVDKNLTLPTTVISVPTGSIAECLTIRSAKSLAISAPPPAVAGVSEFRFAPRRRAVRVINPEELRAVARDRDMEIVVPPPRRFVFRRRQETIRASPIAPSPERRHSLRPVSSPPRPPGFAEEDVAERVRWLLSPPIHELLSDPELGLSKTPYPFQLAGIKWLYDRHSGLLADEMGLGKTMQAILAARLLWREHRLERILIVCPKALIPNWCRELREWWPNGRDGTRVIEAQSKWWLNIALPAVIIKIINYDKLALLVDWLPHQPFRHDLVIVDEAQRFKNPDTKTARAIRALKTDRRWALTGTPLENRAGDVVSIFDFVRPGLLENDDPDYVGERIKPFMLRRRTQEVLSELPDILIEDIELELGP